MPHQQAQDAATSHIRKDQAQASASNLHIFGIRHHGPGSACSLRQALEKLRPDIVLVEGPPDAEPILPLLAHPQMQPPVALLLYVPDDPQRAVFYPFAIFSPEWQAIHYALTNAIPVRFMDLPQAHQLAIPETPDESSAAEGNLPASDTATTAELPSQEVAPIHDAADSMSAHPRSDPLAFLAQAAGYSDGERWWEQMVEQRHDATDLFAAILEAMRAVRAEMPSPADPLEARREEQREAFMRKTIRQAQREGFQRIAVVCGAWHAPVLHLGAGGGTMPAAKADDAQLKGLPRTKVQATWVPWTYDRLAYRSGYGAGIESPGWYHHLFTCASASHTATEVAVRWMTRVAWLLRNADLDASSAHVIEAVRLSEALAAMRDQPRPGLIEMNEAARSIFCFDSDLPMRLIHEQLIVSDTLGTVPDETPMVPLQQDLQRLQKRLRLAPEATWRDLDLDLRKPTDLERSYLLHRLNLLGIPWGEIQRTNVGKEGTFHELWRIQWQPELAIKLIEASMWGNTVEQAATSCARAAADSVTTLPPLTQLIDQALLSNLTAAIPHITQRLAEQAALTSDVVQMMEALPSLANVLRYGDVRQTDAGAVTHVVDGLVTRICIGLPGACAALNDEAAAAMFKHLVNVHGVIALLQNTEHLAVWQRVLRQMADQEQLHGLLAGRCVRLLLDQRVFDSAEVARRMGLSLVTAVTPDYAAAWIEGLLAGSGTLLVHDHTLWQVIDDWITNLSGEVFPQLLPLLRRTFATFQPPERRNLGERVRSAQKRSIANTDESATGFDPVRAEAVLPLVAQLLGIRGEASLEDRGQGIGNA